jgi:hypothetical protein
MGGGYGWTAVADPGQMCQQVDKATDKLDAFFQAQDLQADNHETGRRTGPVAG